MKKLHCGNSSVNLKLEKVSSFVKSLQNCMDCFPFCGLAEGICANTGQVFIVGLRWYCAGLLLFAGGMR